MSGAVSFVLGLLGLGAAGGINLGQSVSQKKKEAELAEMYGWNETDVEVKKMRERVRKEWWSIPDCHPNCLGKWPSACRVISVNRTDFYRKGKRGCAANAETCFDFIFQSVKGGTDQRFISVYL